MDIVYKGRAYGADAEAERDGRNKPAGPDPLTGHIGGDLEEDIGDVEHREDLIVVVVLQLQVLLQTGQFRVADVCSVNETKQIE